MIRGENRGESMINFLNNMNLLPTNFIVANIVEILKEDPDNGVEKLYEMSKSFITDPQIQQIVNEIKYYYDTHPSVKRYIKNMVYNTHKNCLNHFLQNVAIKEFWEGLSKREKNAQALQINVPHAIVINMGMNCNFACKGCLCQTDPNLVLPLNEVDRLVMEGRELGIHLFVLTGGEPFMNDGLLKLYEKYSDVEFIVLTNGSLLDDVRCQQLVQLGNVLPLLILEGNQEQVAKVTDSGVYSMVMQTLDRMKAYGLLFGIVTPTKLSNLEVVMSDPFILPLIRKGSRIHAFITTENDQAEEKLDATQLKWLDQNIGFMRQNRPYMAVHLNSANPFVCRCVVGPVSYHFELGEMSSIFNFPQISSKNSMGQRLTTVLKAVRY